MNVVLALPRWERVWSDRDRSTFLTEFKLNGGGSFADMDVGKGREQDAVSFGYFSSCREK
ncbi:MAG: hypothetical protein ACI845_002226 [Gammaproteobacteria bacterium]|jgi:hypothetical protein